MYIFDIDGTLADCDHRMPFISTRPKNFKAFYKAARLDSPIVPMCAMARALFRDDNDSVVFCTGRPESLRADTCEWLARHLRIPVAEIDSRLYMRADKDYRKDDIVKQELLCRMLDKGLKPRIAIDDRPRVCDMWKRCGLIVLRAGDKEAF